MSRNSISSSSSSSSSVQHFVNVDMDIIGV